MIYYIADMHFGHENVIRFDDRPFADTEQMDEVLIQNWNERITADDTVYVLGDAFWKNEENSIRIMQRLQGHKHLIQGNHDRVKGKLRPYWESIEQYAEVNDENRLFSVTTRFSFTKTSIMAQSCCTGMYIIRANGRL